MVYLYRLYLLGGPPFIYTYNVSTFYMISCEGPIVHEFLSDFRFILLHMRDRGMTKIEHDIMCFELKCMNRMNILQIFAVILCHKL